MGLSYEEVDVKKAIDGLRGNYDVEAVEYIDPKDVGYIGYNNTLIHVRIRTHPIMEYVYYDVIVDVDKMKEMGVRYGGSPTIMMGVHDWSIIPPDAYWYIHIINSSFSLSREVSVQTIRAGVEFEPKDATVYVMILDEGNFTKFKNGAPFDTPVLIDTSTNKSIKVDGSRPISSGWKPGLSMINMLSIRERSFIRSQVQKIPVAKLWLLEQRALAVSIETACVKGWWGNNGYISYLHR